MANVIPEEGSRFEDPDTVDAQVREYAKIKASMEVLEARQKELRSKLFTVLDDEGLEDDKGNIQYELPSAIDGIVRLEKQRRVTRKLNEPLAEEILTTLGLYDDIFELKPVLNEDALMAAFYEDKLTEEQLDDMFPANVVWALRTVKK
jgi:hypothetical protein